MPRLLQRYVLKEMVPALLLSIVALMAIFFVGLSVSFTREGLSIVQMYYVIPYIFMLSLPYALPSAFLLTGVLIFGRLSSRHELDAMRASGVNLLDMMVPPLLVAAVFGCGTFFLNHYLFPWTVTRVNVMRSRLLTDVARQVGKTQRQFMAGAYLMYVGSVDRHDNSWKNVAAIKFTKEIPSKVLIAPRAYWRLIDENTARLDLEDGKALEPQLTLDETAQPTMTFQNMSVIIPLNEKGPSLDRPRYLPLGRLIQEMRKRDEDAAGIFAQMPLETIHPKASHWKVQLEKRKADAEDAKLSDEYRAKKKIADNSSASLEKMDADLRTAAAIRANAQARLAEAKSRLAEQTEYQNNLRRELERRRGEGVSRDERESLENDINLIGKKISDLEALSADFEKQAGRANDAANEVSNRMQAEQEKLAQAEKIAASAFESSQKAHQEADRLKFRRDALDTVRRWIECRMEFSFRNAGAVTCFIFMLVGMPLGIVSRRGTIIGALAISFAAVLLVYFPLIMVGETLAEDGYLTPWIGEWMANAVMACAGAVLIFRGVKR